MVEPIRFFFDQHILFAAANRLRQRGIDVLTAQEAGRCGLPDTDQLRFPTAQGWVMVTFDRDYLLLDASSVSHAGIAWCLANKYSIGQLISALLLVHGALSCDELRNHVEFL